MVLYRKYRPQSLDDLVGQEPVVQALKSAIIGGKLAHAYLFCGPKGTGKTSTARILAKIVNCDKFSKDLKLSNQDNKFFLPCNQCPACLSITDGTNLDVVEMDAASNRGIEDIRNLKDNIKLAPTSATKKVYIIDEAHMLTAEAFNALLKTLEEPPSHVLFILATTEMQKIPVTILSRVQKLDFKPASLQSLVTDLEEIAQKEGIKVSEALFLKLAKKAQGSFRDAVKFLDQISTLKNIDEQSVDNFLGAISSEEQIKLLQAISLKNPSEGLKTLSQLIQEGAGVKDLTLSLLESLRQMLLIKNGVGESLVKVEFKEEDYQRLVTVATSFNLPQLIWTIGCFQQSLEQARYVSLPLLPLELAIVESCLAQKSDEDRVPQSRETIGKIKQEDKIVINSPVSEKDHNIPASSLSLVVEDNSVSDLVKIRDRWSYILETVKAYNFSLEALLRSAKVGSCEGRLVVIEVPYSFHQRIMDAPKSREVLESILSDILGRSVSVNTILSKSQIKREELANIEIAPDDEIVRLAAEIFTSDVIN